MQDIEGSSPKFYTDPWINVDGPRPRVNMRFSFNVYFSLFIAEGSKLEDLKLVVVRFAECSRSNVEGSRIDRELFQHGTDHGGVHRPSVNHAMAQWTCRNVASEKTKHAPLFWEFSSMTIPNKNQHMAFSEPLPVPTARPKNMDFFKVILWETHKCIDERKYHVSSFVPTISA